MVSQSPMTYACVLCRVEEALQLNRASAMAAATAVLRLGAREPANSEASPRGQPHFRSPELSAPTEPHVHRAGLSTSEACAYPPAPSSARPSLSSEALSSPPVPPPSRSALSSAAAAVSAVSDSADRTGLAPAPATDSAVAAAAASPSPPAGGVAVRRALISPSQPPQAQAQAQAQALQFRHHGQSPLLLQHQLQLSQAEERAAEAHRQAEHLSQAPAPALAQTSTAAQPDADAEETEKLCRERHALMEEKAKLSSHLLQLAGELQEEKKVSR